MMSIELSADSGFVEQKQESERLKKCRLSVGMRLCLISFPPENTHTRCIKSQRGKIFVYGRISRLPKTVSLDQLSRNQLSFVRNVRRMEVHFVQGQYSRPSLESMFRSENAFGRKGSKSVTIVIP